MLRSVRSALLKSSLTTLACGLLFAVTAHADVYKYKDEKGNVLYTDKPMFLPAERLSIKTENANIVDLDNANDSQQTDTQRKAAASEAPKRKAKENDAAGKDELCKQARKDYLNRMNAQSIYEEQPNGQKRVLSAKEMDAARAASKQAMDSMCN